MKAPLEPPTVEVVQTSRLKVTQANALARSAQQMTLMEKRLLALIISRVRREDEDFTTYRIPIVDIENLLGLNTKASYSILDEATTKLLSRVVRVEGANGGWEKFQWVSKARYIPKEESDTGLACLDLRLHEDLRPLLLQLNKKFGSIPLEQIVSLPSFNSIRIFEILYHESYALSRSILRFELEDLKLRIGIEGKYRNYKDFRKNVLDRAQKDCKRFTGLEFGYQPIKEGRKVVEIQFTVRPNRESAQSGNLLPSEIPMFSLSAEAEAETERRQLERELQESGFMFDAADTIDRYGHDYVRETLKLAKRTKAKAERSAKPIQNLGGLINAMLRDGVARSSRTTATDPLSKPPDEERIKQVADALVQAYADQVDQFFDEAWTALSRKQRDEVHAVMKDRLDRFTLKQLESDGWRGLIYEAARQRILVDGGFVALPQKLESVDSFVEAEQLLTPYPLNVRRKVMTALGRAS
ncbi:MAG: replication initiation protein [Trueperaceae bacterium]|nr:MAG: replication initiation protein [Trueperaceae bacterium]